MDDPDHYIEIVVNPFNFRFYGLGQWKVQRGDEWRTINAIYVPSEALRIAARECEPARLSK